MNLWTLDGVEYFLTQDPMCQFTLPQADPCGHPWYFMGYSLPN